MTNEISVIIPSYKRLESLKYVMPSYINQRGVKEIIIVDDVSDEETRNYLRELAKKHSKIKLILNKKNLGLPATRLVGFKATTAPYIFYGENDLELSTNHLITLVDHLKKTNADIIAGRRIWMGKNESNEEALKHRNTLKGEPVNYLLLTTNCEIKIKDDTELPLIEASMLIKREVLQDIFFDMYYRKNAWREETDFQINAGIHGYKLVSCPHTTTYHLYKENDKGGNHSASLINYEKALFSNNTYMINKYWPYIQEKFNIPNKYIHIGAFIYYRSKRLLLILFHEKVASLKKII